MASEPIRLNLGCGNNKIPGFFNIDAEPKVKPDKVWNFVEAGIPFKSGTIEEVVLFHTIEHIQKRKHKQLLEEIFRVLRPGGTLLISYPEFERCIDNWKTNRKGMRDFWEATIFGRQLFSSDFHVCAMHTPLFKMLLSEVGFQTVDSAVESIHQDQNTVIRAIKTAAFVNYEKLCEKDMAATKIIRVGPPKQKEKVKHAHR